MWTVAKIRADYEDGGYLATGQKNRRTTSL